LNLNASFSVTIEGVLNKDGRFDAKNTKFIKSEGDKEMVEVAKQAIEAVNDSGFLGYLENLGSNKITWTLGQDEKQLFSTLQSVQPNENKAKTISSGFNLIIAAGKNKRKGKDEEVLLNSLQVTSQGNNVIFNMAMPKEIAQEMIQRKLAEISQRKSSNSSK